MSIDLQLVFLPYSTTWRSSHCANIDISYSFWELHCVTLHNHYFVDWVLGYFPFSVSQCHNECHCICLFLYIYRLFLQGKYWRVQLLGNRVVSYILTSNGTDKFFHKRSVLIYTPTSSALQHQIPDKPTNAIIILSNY